jgi:antitoxin CptB
VTGEAETPGEFRTAVFERMRAYVPDFEPEQAGDKGQAGANHETVVPVSK